MKSLRFLWVTSKNKSHFPKKALSLAQAVIRDQGENIRKLVSEGAPLNAKDPDGLSVLSYAVRYCRKPGTVEMLLDMGASVNEENRQGITPLIVAAGFNKPDMVSVLLSRGAPSKDLSTVLLASLSLEAGADVVRILLDNGADPNAKDGEGITALMYSTGLEPEVMEMLIKQGALVNAQDENGLTAYMYAIEQDGPLPYLEMLTEADADINLPDRLGLTVLMLASSDDSKFDAVDYLLSDGADPNLIADDGRTALMTACQFNQGPAIIQRLIDAGADVDAKDSRGLLAYDYIPDDSPLLDDEELITLLIGDTT